MIASLRQLESMNIIQEGGCLTLMNGSLIQSDWLLQRSKKGWIPDIGCFDLLNF